MFRHFMFYLEETEKHAFGLESKMKVTKVIDNQGMPREREYQLTEQELQCEYNYILAEKMTKALLDSALISKEEYNQIMKKNRDSFSPLLARIMPDLA